MKNGGTMIDINAIQIKAARSGDMEVEFSDNQN